MARVPNTLDLVEVTEHPWFSRFAMMLRRIYEQVSQAINGRISFGNGTTPDNIDGVWISVTTPGTANTDFTVTHNLGRVPVGYIVMRKSAAVDVYTGSVAATTTQLTLRATVISVDVVIFVV